MGWYKIQERYAEGPGDWELHYFLGSADQVSTRDIETETDSRNEWNHGYRGCTVELVPDDQIPVEVLMREAEETLAQHRVLQEKLRDLAETIRLSCMSTPSTPGSP